MKSYLVSYATDDFLASQTRLSNSGRRYGIAEIRSWNRRALEGTDFYQRYKNILDLPRGAGYWLWKPFIIKKTFQEVDDGDILVYSDAGIEIIKELSPLFQLCLKNDGLLLFAGHYEDAGGLGSNICAKWTKRDCFVFMDCDLPCFHRAPMLDASFMIFSKKRESQALISEWFSYCLRKELLTDQPNECGLPNLPGFVEHRHDQSILSLLATRKHIELFRHPSQYGNHLKEVLYQEPGEWTRYPYRTNEIYMNSPYGTLLNHHRGRMHRYCHITKSIMAPLTMVYRAWTEPELLKRWLSFSGYTLVDAKLDLRHHGRYHFVMRRSSTGEELHIAGSYLEIDGPQKLVFTWYWYNAWPLKGPNPIETRVEVELGCLTDSTQISLRHELFPSTQTQNGHKKGWETSLSRLATIFS